MTRDKTGVISASGFTSFETLEQRGRKIAAGLENMGVGPGTCVALLMRNDTPFLEISYAVMRLGAYAVPLNWHFKAEEIAYILADCDAKALFAHDDLLAAAAGVLPAGLPVFTVTTPPSLMRAHGTVEPTPPVIDAIAYEPWRDGLEEHAGPIRPAPMSMIYTSGTTGVPKGVRRSAQTAEETAVLDGLRSTVYGLKPGARTLLPGPLYHSAPNSFGLKAGKVCDLLVLMDRFDAEELLRVIEREAIDTVFMVPTMFVRLLKLPPEVRARYDVSSLRHVVHAAAPCPADVKSAMLEWWGPVIYEFYGGTETGPVSFATPQDALYKPGTVGRASPGSQIHVLAEDGTILPEGAVGEIFSRIEGYPDFTYNKREAMRDEVEQDGFITCGDMGYLDAEGYLFICDRRRDMVISGGVNIYPAEIEGVLQAMAGVHDCAVFGIPDAEFGEALMAVVEPTDGVDLSPEGVRSHLATSLANYKVPKAVEIRRGLPREDSGKIFKRRLRDPYWVGVGRKI